MSVLARKRSNIILTIIFAVMAAFIGYVAAKAWQGSKSIFISGKNPASQLLSFLFDGKKLIGEDRGQVNILLLGIGGPGHEGPYLSDTIMLASVKTDTGEISFISIPRDTLVTIPGLYGEHKINHAYALAAAEQGPRAGITQARQTVEQYLGIDIPYAIVVDFDGFIKAVDRLGGIDVQIEKTFTDSHYPDDKYGYIAPVTFKAGIEHMDGKRALIYARSRYSTSDFDRARRQQKVIEAFKSRVSELNIIKDIGTINKLFDDFAYNIATNFEPAEIKRLSELTLNIPNSKIYTSVLDPTTGLVCAYTSKEKGYHITLCPGKTAGDIHQFVQTSFARGHLVLENPSVEIQNATRNYGLAQAVADQLSTLNIRAIPTNAPRITNPYRTVIYDLTGGQKPNSLAVLLVALGAKVSNNTSTIQLVSSNPVDFLVVLGTDYTPPHLEVINLDPPEPVEESNMGEEGNNEDDEEQDMSTNSKRENQTTRNNIKSSNDNSEQNTDP